MSECETEGWNCNGIVDLSIRGGKLVLQLSKRRDGYLAGQ